MCSERKGIIDFQGLSVAFCLDYGSGTCSFSAIACNLEFVQGFVFAGLDQPFCFPEAPESILRKLSVTFLNGENKTEYPT